MKNHIKSLLESFIDDEIEEIDIELDTHTDLLNHPDVIKNVLKLLNDNKFVNSGDKLKKAYIENGQKEYILKDEFGHGPFLRYRIQKYGKVSYPSMISHLLQPEHSKVANGWELYSRKRNKFLKPAELVSDKDNEFYYTTVISPDRSTTYTMKSDKNCILVDNYIDIKQECVV